MGVMSQERIGLVRRGASRPAARPQSRSARAVAVRLATAVVAVAFVGLAVLPASVGAVTVTVGPADLSATGSALACVAFGSCTSHTYSQTALPEAGTVLTAPTDGVITAWRVHGSTSGSGDVRLRVIHPAGVGQFTGAGTSAPASALDGATANATSLPIQAGDYIGVDLRSGGSTATVNFRTVSGASSNFWSPAPPDGSTTSPTSSNANNDALEFNASVQLSPPVVSGVSPPSGSTTGGQAVTITGAHLAGATAVTFGSTPAAGFSASNGQITATAPAAAAGTVDVRVATPAGTSDTSLADHYTFVAPPLRRPAVTRLSQSASRWRLGNGLVKFARAKPPVGTTYSFSLNEPARVRLDFTQSAAGRRVKKRCVAPSKSNRRKRRCTRTFTVGTLSFNAHAGKNKVRFQGRISKKKKLKPGRYKLVITATVGRLRSAPRSISFTIVR
jgi:hypothetical protein